MTIIEKWRTTGQKSNGYDITEPKMIHVAGKTSFKGPTDSFHSNVDIVAEIVDDNDDDV